MDDQYSSIPYVGTDEATATRLGHFKYREPKEEVNPSRRKLAMVDTKSTEKHWKMKTAANHPCDALEGCKVDHTLPNIYEMVKEAVYTLKKQNTSGAAKI